VVKQNYCRAERLRCGTTALGAFVISSRLVVFNIGDCQAVLYSRGEAVPMSDSHKANRPDEAQRIAEANGWVSEEK
jgi:protein phosphatase 2C